MAGSRVGQIRWPSPWESEWNLTPYPRKTDQLSPRPGRSSFAGTITSASALTHRCLTKRFSTSTAYSAKTFQVTFKTNALSLPGTWWTKWSRIFLISTPDRKTCQYWSTTGSDVCWRISITTGCSLCIRRKRCGWIFLTCYGCVKMQDHGIPTLTHVDRYLAKLSIHGGI